jgi:hypothetical protein
MFLVGGPAFSGTTLLALLLSQGSLLCLDEPDFHDPDQVHRGIPFLRELFPGAALPEPPEGRLAYEEATDLIEQCERGIHPLELGIKTCNAHFLGYAESYRQRGYPVICIVRDIRDALARPLPGWLTEEKLNDRYRMIWKRVESMDLLIRYEELVADADGVMERMSALLGHRLEPRHAWLPEQVNAHMLKLDRHVALKLGRVSDSRVGVWRTSERKPSLESHETARLMGY